MTTVYIVTITVGTRSLLQGVYALQDRAEREAARLREIPVDETMTVYVTATQIIE